MKFFDFTIIKSTKACIVGAMLFACTVPASGGEKLTGTPIGTAAGFNYEQGQVVWNIQGNAFDGNLNTYFATDARSYTWVGLDLGTPHVIDRVGWSPRNDGVGPTRVRLGIIQGANQEDFLDAVPLYIIRESGIIGTMSYGDVDCSKGFRYVRFVSTGDNRCNIAELEFYGTPGEGTDEKLFQITNLPTVCVNTVGAQEPYDKEHDITANIIIITDNKAYVDKPGTIRERGNASRSFPKKPWRLKFEKKQQVLPDAPAKAKKWTLINNYGDKTLMRNLIAFDIAERLGMKYVPYGHAVDVVLNGEYKGCYQLCDQVEVNPGRVEITEMETTDIEGEALTGGYFVEVDAYANEEPEGEWFVTNRYRIPVTIKSPDDGGTPEQHAYILSYFNKLENMVWGSNLSTPGDNDYRNIFDIESFLQHFIVGELSGNTDTYWSTYMYKDRGSDVIYTGPVWDFDIAFDNDNRTYPIHSRVGSRCYLYESGLASSANNMDNFVRRIMKNDNRTKGDLKRVWSLARNDRRLTYDDVASFIDSKAAELMESQRLNFMRWPIMNDWVHQNPTISGSYNGEVSRVKSYLADRFRDLDAIIGYDPSLSGVNSVESLGDMPLRLQSGVVSMGDGREFEVYAIDGRSVYRGTGATPALPGGVYIVRSGAQTAKVLLK
ncbi:MAG: CotH kinase family protein [Muribaculaceae bacterium]|nr:CotH kinase family protein [Muribaculaceae bacterium]